MSETRRLLAVFIDFENLALGLRDRPERFDIHRVIGRLVEKGQIVVKRAYADWRRFASFTSLLHEHAIELIEIPVRGMTGKNSADMRLAVDVMDLCYSKDHIDTFVILSGDSDFSPLVSKLKENGKTVIGLGVKESTSDLLRDNCNEFIYYEDLEAEGKGAAVDRVDRLPKKEREVFALLLDSLQALQRENRDVYWASLIKETMKRKRPSFTESYYGFQSFGDLLEAAAERGFVTLSRDGARRTHIVTAFGERAQAAGGGAGEIRSGRPEEPGRGGAPGQGHRGGRHEPRRSEAGGGNRHEASRHDAGRHQARRGEARRGDGGRGDVRRSEAGRGEAGVWSPPEASRDEAGRDAGSENRLQAGRDDARSEGQFEASRDDARSEGQFEDSHDDARSEGRFETSHDDARSEGPFETSRDGARSEGQFGAGRDDARGEGQFEASDAAGSEGRLEAGQDDTGGQGPPEAGRDEAGTESQPEGRRKSRSGRRPSSRRRRPKAPAPPADPKS